MVYIVKSAVEYLVENLYQTDKIFVDCFELHSDFAALLTKKEVKCKYKYKRAAQEKKKKIRSACILCVLYTSIYVLLAWTSVGNMFRPATLTSTLDTDSTLLSDFNFANPCYQILLSKLHFISWAEQVHLAVIPRSINYHTSHRLPPAV